MRSSEERRNFAAADSAAVSNVIDASFFATCFACFFARLRFGRYRTETYLAPCSMILPGEKDISIDIKVGKYK